MQDVCSGRWFESWLLALGLAASALAGVAAAAEGRYPSVDSRTLTDGANPNFVWIDNDELLFVSATRNPGATRAWEQVSYAISRWNTRSGAVTRVRAFGHERPSLCLHEGLFLYGRRLRDGSLEAYHGKLGESEQRVDPRRYVPLFCRPRAEVPALPKWTGGREIRLLEKLGAGFVDFGEDEKASENTPVRLYRYGMAREEGIELPFGRRGIAKRFPYHEFQRAFFVASDYPQSPRPQRIPYPVYWLYADGRVEKIADVPWGPWRQGSLSVVPTRAGLVVASSNFYVHEPTDLRHAGLYLLAEGRMEKLLEGWIAGLALAVSPDGCRIAFSYSPVVTERKNVLQAMRLCGGR
jgi:hypothetical protein